MATLKRRLHRKNASGGYDVVYLQTTSDLVLMNDGSTTLTSKISSMDSTISGKADSNHTHSGYAAASHSHPDANTSVAGFMTPAMVTKLNGIAAGANAYTHPAAKQCSYAYTHPSTKQCDAAAGNHTHPELANRIAALESNTSLIYENSSVRNLKHAYFTVDPNTTYKSSSITDLSVNVGFNISRAIYIACTPNFAREIGTYQYARNYTNTQTNGQQILIAEIANRHNVAYEYLLYVYFSGTTVYLRFQNRGRDAAIHCNILDASTNWSFDIVCIQDF